MTLLHMVKIQSKLEVVLSTVITGITIVWLCKFFVQSLSKFMKSFFFELLLICFYKVVCLILQSTQLLNCINST